MAETTLENSINSWPIGVFRYNVGNIWEHLSRNIGKFGVDSNDGFPIGYLANPYYSSSEKTPWFKLNTVKDSANDYIDYVNTVRTNGNVSVNLSSTPLKWRDTTLDSVGSTRMSSLNSVIGKTSTSTIDISNTDTLLGDTSQYYLGVSMKDAYVANSKKSVLSKGISKDMSSYCGINSKVEESGNIFDRFQIDEDRGRYVNTYHITSSPIYNKSYPNIGLDTGKWRNYYELMNVTNNYTKAYILGSIYGMDLDDELGLNKPDNINAFDLNFTIENYLGKDHSRYNFFRTYFDTMHPIGTTSGGVGYNMDLNGNVIRYHFNLGNSEYINGTRYEYGEAQKQFDDNVPVDSAHTVDMSVMGNKYDSFDQSSISSANDLLNKTNKAFKNGRYRTMISRFYNAGADEKEVSQTNTAIDIWTKHPWGMSHGRNLLLKGAMTGDVPTYNGYQDPYCRVWTYHHEYNRIRDMIRPFFGEKYSNGQSVGSGILTQEDLAGETDDDGVVGNGNERNHYHWNIFSARDRGDSFSTGRYRLGEHGVINQKNGLVNLAPIREGRVENGTFTDEGQNDVPIKKCMFSIENLAWKGETGHNGRFKLTKEQTGPLGGRIMWFPPYGLKFTEQTHANWNETQFIGRGEPIMTYTDTKRSGNLSWTILIDHPSVIDYWNLNHKDSNGIRGGNGLDGDEQTLLRFFAGCDLLIPQPFNFKASNEEKKKPENTPSTNPTPATGTKRIIFFVFYPNNYSGSNDAPNPNTRHTTINAIEYLLNGVCTQLKIEPTSSQVLQDLPTSLDLEYYSKNKSEEGFPYQVGGYEVRNDGISLEDSYDQVSHDLYKSVKVKNPQTKLMQYATIGKQTLTTLKSSDGTDLIRTATRYVSPTNWYKTANDIKTPDKNGENLSNWFYRVDNEWCGQYFTDNTNYIDKKSYNMNSSKGISTVSATALDWGYVKETDLTDATFVSLADVYCTFHSNAKTALNGYYSDENIEVVNYVKTHPECVKSVTINGDASAQGYGVAKNGSFYERDKNYGIAKYTKNQKKDKSPNEQLALNRATTVKNWLANEMGELKNLKIGINSSAETTANTDTSSSDKVTVENPVRVTGQVDNFGDKFSRHAMVIIEYTPGDKVENAANSMSNGQNNNITTMQGKMKTISTTDTQLGMSQYANMIRKTPDAISPSALKATAASSLSKGGGIGTYDMNESLANWCSEMAKDKGLTVSEVATSSLQKYRKDESEIEKRSDSIGEEDNDSLSRYDLESIFFKMLPTMEPALHKKITEKIKYFDPAFHSVTPEGFNARLTFLNQCTRAGMTNSIDENGNPTGNANNTSFGRPPVCVLRLGDFYNTKIVIDSLQIDYGTDGLQWDLNPEGIGVQPMMANVSISFTFIGGADLGGPISRLQNALSFNYYSNASVYDNRSEMVEYESDGTPYKFKGIDYQEYKNTSKK
jgi:hypothetical protein